MRRILLCPAALSALVLPASADQTAPIAVGLMVGATKRLWTVAARRSDCRTSDARSVEVVSPPP